MPLVPDLEPIEYPQAESTFLVFDERNFAAKDIGLPAGSFCGKLLGADRVEDFRKWAVKSHFGLWLALFWFLSAPLPVLTLFGAIPKHFAWLCLLGFLTPFHIIVWYDRRVLREVRQTAKAKTHMLIAVLVCTSLGFMCGGDERTVCVLWLFLVMLLGIYDDAGRHNNETETVQALENEKTKGRCGKVIRKLMFVIAAAVSCCCLTALLVGVRSGYLHDQLNPVPINILGSAELAPIAMGTVFTGCAGTFVLLSARLVYQGIRNPRELLMLNVSIERYAAAAIQQPDDVQS